MKEFYPKFKSNPIRNFNDFELIIKNEAIAKLFDPAVIERFAVALNELLKTHSQVVIDLSHVQFISSAMLGRLVMAWMETTKRGGKFVLCGASEAISEIFHLAGLNHRLEIYPNSTTALTAISGKAS